MKKAKRELILEAAVHVFSSKGYHNARMEEIAAVAGIGKGTIYEYFASKLQLFQDMLNKSLQVYYQNFNPEEMKQLSVEQRLRIIFETHIKFCRDNKELTRLVFWDSDIFDEELRDWIYTQRQEKEERVVEIIQEGIARGELRELDPMLVKVLLTGSVAAMWAPITLDGWETAPEELAHDVTDILMNGLKK
ncbi:MAG: TetR/AcrR family transcriptional regulator [Syntrophomonas sp.]|nr:TetR/AcrR family transcriptional regulator [Syntrophomonas sp.]